MRIGCYSLAMNPKIKNEVVAVLTKQGRGDLARSLIKMTTAAEEVDQHLLKQVQDLTDRNDHTAARILVAEKVLKDRKLAGAYQAIATLMSYMGHMDPRVGKFEYEVLDKQRLQPQLESRGLEAYWQAM